MRALALLTLCAVACDVDHLKHLHPEQHCGTPPINCTHLPNVEPSKVSCSEAGECLLAPSPCKPGFDDCDSDPGTGCEADLFSQQTCGDCHTSCNADQICSGDQLCECAAAQVCRIDEAGNPVADIYSCAGRCTPFAPYFKELVQEQPPTEVYLSALSYPASVLAEDVDGDGEIDLVSANEGSPPTNNGNIAIVWGRSDGSFGGWLHENPSFFDVEAPGVAAQPKAIVMVDVDRDGTKDFVVANWAAGTIGVVRWIAGMRTGQPVENWPVGGPGLDVLAVGDFDGDGYADLAAASDDETVALLMNEPNGTAGVPRKLTVRQTLQMPPYAPARALVTGDFNGDGILDLAALASDRGSVHVFNGDGHGHLTPGQVIDVIPYATAMVATSSDQMGTSSMRLDLVIASLDFAQTLTQEDAGLVATEPWSLGFSGSPNRSEIRSLAVGDWNRDGYADLITLDSQDDELAVWIRVQRGTFVNVRRMKNGAGAQDARNGPMGATSVGIHSGAADLVVTGNARADSLGVVHAYEPSVEFCQASELATGFHPLDLVARDLDGDGNVDLAGLNYLSHDMSVFYGRTGGRFDPQTRIPVCDRPTHITSGDLDGDGRIDLVVTCEGRADAGEEARAQSGVATLLNTGNREQPFTVRFYQTGALSNVVTLFDQNGDGSLDVITGDQFEDAIGALFNDGAGGLSPSEPLFPRDLQNGQGSCVGLFAGTVRTDPRLLYVVNCLISPVGGPQLYAFAAKPQEPLVKSFLFHISGLTSAATIWAGDLNENGMPDLVMYNGPNGTIDVLRDLVDGWNGQVERLSFPTPRWFEVLDNRILAVVGETNAIHLFVPNDSRSAFDGTPEDLPQEADPSRVAIAQLDGDHLDDFIVAHAEPNSLSVHLSRTRKCIEQK